MSDTATQIISGRVVSGNPLKLSTIINSSGNRAKLYQITIAIKKDSIEMKSLFQKVDFLRRDKWPQEEPTSMSSRKFDWGVKEYNGYVGSHEPYVDYCLDCYLISLHAEQLPLIIMPDEQGGWKFIEFPNIMKTGDYVNIGLELNVDNDDTETYLQFKITFVALTKIGTKVDLEHDTEKKRREMFIAKVSRTLGKSPNLAEPVEPQLLTQD